MTYMCVNKRLRVITYFFKQSFNSTFLAALSIRCLFKQSEVEQKFLSHQNGTKLYIACEIRACFKNRNQF